jgi:hypothetical protein
MASRAKYKMEGPKPLPIFSTMDTRSYTRTTFLLPPEKNFNQSSIKRIKLSITTRDTSKVQKSAIQIPGPIRLFPILLYHTTRTRACMGIWRKGSDKGPHKPTLPVPFQKAFYSPPF